MISCNWFVTTKIKYDIILISTVPLQEGFNEWSSKIPLPCELWTIPGYLFILEEILGRQSTKFPPVKLADENLHVSRAIKLSSTGSVVTSQDVGQKDGKWKIWKFRLDPVRPGGSVGQQTGIGESKVPHFLLSWSARWESISWGR